MVDRTEELHRALQKFINHVNDLSAEEDPGGNGFHREYRELRELAIQNKDTYPATHGKLQHNIRKNRYKDIVPFDSTRVILTEKSGVQGSDYINANYILDAHKREGYIASQGPLPNTLEDFWRMIQEQKVKVVMMACKEVEAGKKKCAQYWAEEGAENAIFGEYQVGCVKTESLADDCDERHLQLITSDATQDVYQYHYTGWPDHGIPDDIDVILAMIKRMRDIRMKDPDHAPVVVHCSAGCGRTGTICAIDYAWEILKSGQLTEEFNLYEIVKSMREQRQSMIQTPEQYEMAHLAVKELFQKHIEIMNESDYVNVVLKQEDEYYNSSAQENIGDDDEYAEVGPDTKKLQIDALDTLEKYMGKEETPEIPRKEETPEISRKEEPQSSEKKVAKIVENSQSEPVLEQEHIVTRLPYENLFTQSYENAKIKDTHATDDTQIMNVSQKRASFEKQPATPPVESGPKFVPSFPPSSPTKSVQKTFTNQIPPTVPRTTVETSMQKSGPTFVQSTAVPTSTQKVQDQSPTTKSGPTFVQSTAVPTSTQKVQDQSPTTKSGPTFLQSTAVPTSTQKMQDQSLTTKSGPTFVQSTTMQSTKVPETSVKAETSLPQQKEQVPEPKFRSVINVGGPTPTIKQGNKPNNPSRTNSIKSQNSVNYELAKPIDEPSRNSLNHVSVNSHAASAVYSVPDKIRDPAVTPDNVYSEVKKVNSSPKTRTGPAETAYETIAVTSVKSAPKGRQYEDVQLPSDGLYSTVADTSSQHNAPPLPRREYQEPEQEQEPEHKSMSVGDKLKNKITNTLFSKTTSSSDNTDKSGSVPGFNQRIEKKVKGPRLMPWNKKSKS